MAPKQAVAGPSRLKGAAPTAAPPPPANVSAFNSTSTHFACAFPVLGSADKVTVWDVTSDRVIYDFEVEGASKVTNLIWTTAPVAKEMKRKKRRKAEDEGLKSGNGEEVVLITTEHGEAILLSPSRREVIRKLEVGKVTAACSGHGYEGVVMAAPSSILLLSSDASTIAHTFALPSNTPPPTAMTLLPTSTRESLHLLIGSQSVVELHLEMRSNKIIHTSSPLPASTTSITTIQSVPSTDKAATFLVISEDDRSVSQYTITQPKSTAKLSYRYSSPTISPVHSAAFGDNTLTLLHASGEVSLFPLPTELDFSRPKSDSKPSIVKLLEGSDERLVRLVRVSMIGKEGNVGASLLCGRLMGGDRLKWVRASYQSPDGGIRASTVVKCDAKELIHSGEAENVGLMFICV